MTDLADMDFVSVKVVAEKLCTTPGQVRRWAAAGKFPPLVHCSRYHQVVDRRDFEDWVQRRRTNQFHTVEDVGTELANEIEAAERR